MGRKIGADVRFEDGHSGARRATQTLFHSLKLLRRNAHRRHSANRCRFAKAEKAGTGSAARRTKDWRIVAAPVRGLRSAMSVTDVVLVGRIAGGAAVGGSRLRPRCAL